MLKSLQDVRSTCDTAGNKQVFVTARADATGGTETLNFTIIDKQVSQDFHFKGGEIKEVSVSHTASGTGEVSVTAPASNLTTRNRLNVDKVPGDDGSGTP